MPMQGKQYVPPKLPDLPQHFIIEDELERDLFYLTKGGKFSPDSVFGIDGCLALEKLGTLYDHIFPTLMKAIHDHENELLVCGKTCMWCGEKSNEPGFIFEHKKVCKYSYVVLNHDWERASRSFRTRYYFVIAAGQRFRFDLGKPAELFRRLLYHHQMPIKDILERDDIKPHLIKSGYKYEQEIYGLAKLTGTVLGQNSKLIHKKNKYKTMKRYKVEWK